MITTNDRFRMKRLYLSQFVWTFTPSLSVLLAIIIAHVYFHVEIPAMTRDVTAIARIHPLSGILSNLGVLLWCATASISLFAALTLREVGPRDAFWFLLGSGFLSTYLMLDDLFQIHEDLAPRYLGLRQKGTLAILGAFVLVYLLAFRHVILQTHFALLVLAMGFLSTSVGVDTVLAPIFWRMGHSELLFEDGAKWLGISCWCSYYVRASHQLLVRGLEVRP